MKEDYEELSNISIVCRYHNEYYHAIISGCSRSVGVTIQDSKGNYLFCLNGPLSPLYKGYQPQFDDISFDTVVSRLKSGYIDLDELMSRLYSITGRGASGFASQSTCPFGQ